MIASFSLPKVAQSTMEDQHSAEHIHSGVVSWKEEAKLCPGIGKGKKISKQEIEERLKEGEGNSAYVVVKKKLI